MTTIKPNAFTRITFKTLGASPIYSGMTPNYVKIGKVAPLLLAMRRDARDCKLVAIAMAGKNNNSTP